MVAYRRDFLDWFFRWVARTAYGLGALALAEKSAQKYRARTGRSALDDSEPRG